MTKFLEEKWKKNDNLMKAALKKMHLKFTRNIETWEVDVRRSGSRCNDHYWCFTSFDANDNVVDEGPNTPESLGEIKYFYDHLIGESIDNIFFGVKNFAELQIKLDLMT